MSANIFQPLGADLASRRLRAANISAEIDEAVAGVCLRILRDCIGQYALDFERILEFFGIKSKSAAYSYTVGICNNAGNAENITEQEIGDLAPDSGKLAKLIYIAR